MAALMSASVAPLVGRASAFSAGRKVACGAANGSAGKVSMRATWMPGSSPPAHLDGSLPCDYGFDPLGLAKEPAQLARFQEAEIIHCRWAMLGVVGVTSVEALGFGTWIEAPVAPAQTFFGSEVPIPLPAVIGLEVFLMAFVESQRGAEKDPMKRMYPGGAFDPVGFSKGDGFEKLKRKEIANGRLAMVAFLGIIGAAQANDNEGPIAALTRHVADPWHATAASNALAVPYL